MQIHSCIKTILAALILLFSCTLAAKDIVDVSFEAPLFCDNYRNSILYGSISFNKGSISKVTSLAYFLDGYPNSPVSNSYTTHKYAVEGNNFTVELKIIDGATSAELAPREYGKLTCMVQVEKDWKNQLKTFDDVSVYYVRQEFSATCKFRGIPVELNNTTCRTSPDLANKVQLINPYNSSRLPFDSVFKYKHWSE